jgi:peptide/nickel transport system substrate-binding protein
MGADAAKAKATDMGFASAEEMLRETVTKAWNIPGVPTLKPYVISTEEGKNDVSGDYYEFVRNPYYWKTDSLGQQLPYMDRLGFTRISGESQKMLLTTEGFLSVSELTGEQVAEAQAGATRGNYRVITWTSSLSYAVKNHLKNFPEKCPYEEVIRGIGAAHPEYWYIE